MLITISGNSGLNMKEKKSYKLNLLKVEEILKINNMFKIY